MLMHLQLLFLSYYYCFLWAVLSNKFKNLDYQGHNILLDDGRRKPQNPPQNTIKDKVILLTSAHNRTDFFNNIA